MQVGSEILPPTECPICETELVEDGPILFCKNKNCEGKLIGNIEKWMVEIKNHFKTKGLANERIQEMWDLQLIRSVPDLYTLTHEDLIERMKSVGRASASNILEFQKFKIIPTDVLLAGLNINGIGKSIWRLILDNGFPTLESIDNATIEELSKIEGVGDMRAEMIINGYKEKVSVIEALFAVGITTGESSLQKVEGVLNGKTFCITGSLSMPREQMQDAIIANGGSVKSGVSSKLDFLICGEDAGSKLDKAQKCGVRVISESDFKEMIR